MFQNEKYYLRLNITKYSDNFLCHYCLIKDKSTELASFIPAARDEQDTQIEYEQLAENEFADLKKKINSYLHNKLKSEQLITIKINIRKDAFNGSIEQLEERTCSLDKFEQAFDSKKMSLFEALKPDGLCNIL